MELDGKRIVVIGGAGFIGSHIVDQLLSEDVREVVVLDNLIRGNRKNIESALLDDRVQFVEGSITDIDLLRSTLKDAHGAFHLAALWLYECVHEPRKALDINVTGTYNVVEACHEAGVERVVYSSSASVYGNALTVPMTEEHPFNNRTMYGATKIAGEQFFRAYNEQHGLDYVGMRYMNVYGPRMDDKGTYVSVIMKVLDRIESGEAPVIFGDGSQSYDFIHVEDVARANILAMKAEATDRFYNIGMGIPTTINELVKRLIALTGSDVEPRYEPQAQSFVTNRLGSTGLAEEDLGFRANIPLEDGLKSVVEWRLGPEKATTPGS
jgi:UDP-glucose 4-epimerase